MLTTIIGTTIGVVMGTIIVSVIGFALCMNKTFMGWYTTKLMATTKEVSVKFIEEFEDL